MPCLRAHHESVERQYSDEALLDDLGRIWGLCGTERLSVAQYRAHGGQHSVSTYLARWGSWAMATELAAQEWPQVARQGERKRRTCLRCGRLFLSDGPHLRRCGTCRDWVASSATPEPIHPLQTGWVRDGWQH